MLKHNQLELLINNAGIGFTTRGRPEREMSRDGYELRFAVNYLAPFLLTHLLMPVIRKNSIDFDNLMLSQSYDGVRAYRQSKLALVMFTFDLAKELKGSGVTVNCLHPATFMDTKMVSESGINPLNSVMDAWAQADVKRKPGARG